MTAADDLNLMMSIPDSAFGEGLRSEARARVEAEIADLEQRLETEIARGEQRLERAVAAEAEVRRLRRLLARLGDAT